MAAASGFGGAMPETIWSLLATAVQWDVLKDIGRLLGQGDRFQFRYIDPIGGQQEITAYCGDREWEAVFCAALDDRDWIGTLRVSVIEI